MDRLARPRALLGLRPRDLSLRQRVRFRITPGHRHRGGVRTRPGRLEPRVAGAGPPSALPRRERPHPVLPGAAVPAPPRLRGPGLSQPDPAGGGDARRSGALATRARGLRRRPVLAARRLLAGFVMVEHRLLRAMEGAPVRHTPVLRPRAPVLFGGGGRRDRSSLSHQRPAGGVARRGPLVVGEAGRQR